MNTEISENGLTHPSGVAVVAPTVKIELNADQLRLLLKSASKTQDAEVKKLGRLSAGSKIHADTKSDWLVMDEVTAELGFAMSELVAAS